MSQIILKDSQTIATAYSAGSSAINVKSAATVAVVSAVTNSAPAAGTFTAANATEIFTKTAHGFLTGLKVQVSNSGGALPTGISAATDYFVIYISANTFYLATSLVNAQAGTFLSITTDGTGTQTVTPTALAGASVKLQGCLDDDAPTASSVWADLPICATGDASKSGSITATANFLLHDHLPKVNYIRAYYTLTAGQLSVAQTTVVKA